MTRCPICGSTLKPEEMQPPYCGAVCAPCDALSEAELQRRYPVWFENLPSVSACYRACSSASKSTWGYGIPVGGGWVVTRSYDQNKLEAANPSEDKPHVLSHEPKQAAIMLWQLIQTLHGRD